MPCRSKSWLHRHDLAERATFETFAADSPGIDPALGATVPGQNAHVHVRPVAGPALSDSGASNEAPRARSRRSEPPASLCEIANVGDGVITQPPARILLMPRRNRRDS